MLNVVKVSSAPSLTLPLIERLVRARWPSLAIKEWGNAIYEKAVVGGGARAAEISSLFSRRFP